MLKSPTRIRSLLQSDPGLRRLERQADEQRWLLGEIQQFLPSPLADHCKAAVWIDERLTLYADSPAWASRLRYLVPGVRRWLASRIPTVEKVQVRVFLPEYARKPPPKRRAARLISAESRLLMMQVAEGFGDHELSRALRRLAKHGE